MKDNTVKCPNCKEAFKVDDSVYTDIVKQVRDQQFQDELSNRLEAAQKEKQAALQLKESELKNTFQQQLAEKQSEIEALPFEHQEVLIEFISRFRELEYELDSIYEKLSSIG